MASPFLFGLATPTDDAEIRHLLATESLPGSVELTYEREPDYFRGNAVMGQTCDVLLARHTPTGELAGILCRAIADYWVNGTIRRLAYLGQLRIAQRFQGRWLSTRSMPLLQQLHEHHPVDGYLSSITRENSLARGILVERARASFPQFVPWQEFTTYAVHMRRTRRPHTKTYQIESANDLDELITFLRTTGAKKQLFPVYDAAMWQQRMRDLALDDILVARQAGHIVATLAVWNQSAYKQTVVQRYHGMLGWLRPVYNLQQHIRGAAALPDPGEPLHMRYASLVCIDDAHHAAFAELLAAALHHTQGAAFLMLGLTQDSPYHAQVQAYAHIPYFSTLYTLRWPHEPAWFADFDQRPAAPELALL